MEIKLDDDTAESKQNNDEIESEEVENIDELDEEFKKL